MNRRQRKKAFKKAHEAETIRLCLESNIIINDSNVKLTYRFIDRELKKIGV